VNIALEVCTFGTFFAILENLNFLNIVAGLLQCIEEVPLYFFDIFADRELLYMLKYAYRKSHYFNNFCNIREFARKF
jgi:hypothetical protein